MVQYANKCFLTASIILIVATVTITVEFEKGIIAIRNKSESTQMTPESVTRTEKLGGLIRMYIANICFLVSSGLWFQGFYYYTQVSLDAGNDVRVIGPLMFKLLASALFTIQPMTTLMRMPVESEVGKMGHFLWANFYAILLFHVGNMFSFAFTLKSYNFFDLFAGSNQMTIAIAFSFMLGTTFLLAGDAKAVEQMKGPNGTGFSKNLAIAYPLIGDAFLLLGSVLLQIPQ